MSAAPDLAAAALVLETAKSVVDAAARHLAATGDVGADQVVAYDLAHAAAAVENAGAILDYGAKGVLRLITESVGTHSVSVQIDGIEAGVIPFQVLLSKT
jgi:hypothetical protein